jgi:hypothetical protein
VKRKRFAFGFKIVKWFLKRNTFLLQIEGFFVVDQSSLTNRLKLLPER